MTPRATLAVVLVLFAAGCATSGGGGPSTPGMAQAMKSWEGHNVYDAIARWGMPDTVGREGTIGVVSWRQDPPDKAPPTSGDPWPILCKRTMQVDAASIIRQARWSGSGCSTDPVDYSPP